MAEWGTQSAKGSRVAWAATRPEKAASRSFEALQVDWVRRAEAVGQFPTLGVSPSERGRWVDEHRFRGDLSLSADGGARRRDVVHAFGDATPGGATAGEIGRLAELWIPATSNRGVYEEVHALREVVPADHLLRALGPRPVDPEQHEVWRGAAQSLQAYGKQWGMGRPGDEIGRAQSCGAWSTYSTARLVAHLEVTRQLETARQRLGWRPPRELEIDWGR
jgi:hypothetical protein